MVNEHLAYDGKTRVFTGENPNVWKYVFDLRGYPAEAVLYRYESFTKRTVLCISTQCGCPVGCTFCGTGNRFLKNLSYVEIVKQVEIVFKDQGFNVTGEMGRCEKLQIMAMSMGESFLNYKEVSSALWVLNHKYPNADLLISTIAPNKPKELVDFITLSKKIYKVGLQFSIHKSTDEERNKIIPYKNKLSLREIRNYGIQWFIETGRNPYINYCIDGSNNSKDDAERLMNLFPPNVFCATFSVVCSADETMTDAGYHNLDAIREFEKLFMSEGYNTRIFDPVGATDIGSGCGQLWYVQQKMKEIMEK